MRKKKIELDKELLDEIKRDIEVNGDYTFLADMPEEDLSEFVDDLHCWKQTRDKPVDEVQP